MQVGNYVYCIPLVKIESEQLLQHWYVVLNV